jgi:hypothetical protein
VPLLFGLAGRQNIECEKVHYEFADQRRKFKFKLNLKYVVSMYVYLHVLPDNIRPKCLSMKCRNMHVSACIGMYVSVCPP